MKVKEESEKVVLKLNIQKTKIMASGPITSWQIDWETVTDFILGSPKSLQLVIAAMKLKDAYFLGRKVMTNLDSILKSRDITLPTKVRLVKAMVFFSGRVRMWELDYKESWALKNWCFWIVVLEKTLESPLDCKEIQPVHPKGDQSWVFIGGTDAEVATPTLWPPDAKSWLIWKDPDAGKDWGQKEKGTTGWDGWMTSPTQYTWLWVDSVSWCGTGRPAHGVAKSQTWLSDWTELN